MNNFKQKNIRYNLSGNTELPNSINSDISLKANQIIYTSINNAYQKMVDNDLYLERSIIDNSNNKIGPLDNALSSEINENTEDGTKYWSDIKETSEELVIYEKKTIPPQDTLSTVLDSYIGSKFFTYGGDTYVLGTNPDGVIYKKGYDSTTKKYSLEKMQLSVANDFGGDGLHEDNTIKINKYIPRPQFGLNGITYVCTNKGVYNVVRNKETESFYLVVVDGTENYDVKDFVLFNGVDYNVCVMAVNSDKNETYTGIYNTDTEIVDSYRETFITSIDSLHDIDVNNITDIIQSDTVSDNAFYSTDKEFGRFVVSMHYGDKEPITDIKYPINRIKQIDNNVFVLCNGALYISDRDGGFRNILDDVTFPNRDGHNDTCFWDIIKYKDDQYIFSAGEYIGLYSLVDINGQTSPFVGLIYESVGFYFGQLLYNIDGDNCLYAIKTYESNETQSKQFIIACNDIDLGSIKKFDGNRDTFVPPSDMIFDALDASNGNNDFLYKIDMPRLVGDPLGNNPMDTNYKNYWFTIKSTQPYISTAGIGIVNSSCPVGIFRNIIGTKRGIVDVNVKSDTTDVSYESNHLIEDKSLSSIKPILGEYEAVTFRNVYAFNHGQSVSIDVVDIDSLNRSGVTRTEIENFDGETCNSIAYYQQTGSEYPIIYLCLTNGIRTYTINEDNKSVIPSGVINTSSVREIHFIDSSLAICVGIDGSIFTLQLFNGDITESSVIANTDVTSIADYGKVATVGDRAFIINPDDISSIQEYGYEYSSHINQLSSDANAISDYVHKSAQALSSEKIYGIHELDTGGNIVFLNNNWLRYYTRYEASESIDQTYISKFVNWLSVGTDDEKNVFGQVKYFCDRYYQSESPILIANNKNPKNVYQLEFSETRLGYEETGKEPNSISDLFGGSFSDIYGTEDADKIKVGIFPDTVVGIDSTVPSYPTNSVQYHIGNCPTYYTLNSMIMVETPKYIASDGSIYFGEAVDVGEMETLSPDTKDTINLNLLSGKLITHIITYDDTTDDTGVPNPLNSTYDIYYRKASNDNNIYFTTLNDTYPEYVMTEHSLSQNNKLLSGVNYNTLRKLEVGSHVKKWDNTVSAYTLHVDELDHVILLNNGTMLVSDTPCFLSNVVTVGKDYRNFNLLPFTDYSNTTYIGLKKGLSTYSKIPSRIKYDHKNDHSTLYKSVISSGSVTRWNSEIDTEAWLSSTLSDLIDDGDTVRITPENATVFYNHGDGVLTFITTVDINKISAGVSDIKDLKLVTLIDENSDEENDSYYKSVEDGITFILSGDELGVGDFVPKNNYDVQVNYISHPEILMNVNGSLFSCSFYEDTTLELSDSVIFERLELQDAGSPTNTIDGNVISFMFSDCGLYVLYKSKADNGDYNRLTRYTYDNDISGYIIDEYYPIEDKHPSEGESYINPSIYTSMIETTFWSYDDKDGDTSHYKNDYYLLNYQFLDDSDPSNIVPIAHEFSGNLSDMMSDVTMFTCTAKHDNKVFFGTDNGIFILPDLDDVPSLSSYAYSNLKQLQSTNGYKIISMTVDTSFGKLYAVVEKDNQRSIHSIDVSQLRYNPKDGDSFSSVAINNLISSSSFTDELVWKTAVPLDDIESFSYMRDFQYLETIDVPQGQGSVIVFGSDTSLKNLNYLVQSQKSFLFKALINEHDVSSSINCIEQINNELVIGTTSGLYTYSPYSYISPEHINNNISANDIVDIGYLNGNYLFKDRNGGNISVSTDPRSNAQNPYSEIDYPLIVKGSDIFLSSSYVGNHDYRILSSADELSVYVSDIYYFPMNNIGYRYKISSDNPILSNDTISGYYDIVDRTYVISSTRNVDMSRSNVSAEFKYIFSSHGDVFANAIDTDGTTLHSYVVDTSKFPCTIKQNTKNYNNVERYVISYANNGIELTLLDDGLYVSDTLFNMKLIEDTPNSGCIKWFGRIGNRQYLWIGDDSISFNELNNLATNTKLNDTQLNISIDLQVGDNRFLLGSGQKMYMLYDYGDSIFNVDYSGGLSGSNIQNILTTKYGDANTQESISSYVIVTDDWIARSKFFTEYDVFVSASNKYNFRDVLFDSYYNSLILTDVDVKQTNYQYELERSNSMKLTNEEVDNLLSLDVITNESINNHVSSYHISSVTQYLNDNTIPSDFSTKSSWLSEISTDTDIVISNDMVETVEFGDNESRFISAYISNVDTDNKPQQLTSLSYILKTQESGIKELYIYLPTTNTKYFPHVMGIVDCESYGTELVRKNSEVGKLGDISYGQTSLSVLIDGLKFDANEIYSYEINGNSLPLSIYKDTEKSCNGSDSFYHSYVLPTINIVSTDISSTQLDIHDGEYYDMSGDISVDLEDQFNQAMENAQKELEDQMNPKVEDSSGIEITENTLVFRNIVFGTDAQAIRITAK